MFYGFAFVYLYSFLSFVLPTPHDFPHLAHSNIPVSLLPSSTTKKLFLKKISHHFPHVAAALLPPLFFFLPHLCT